MPFLAKLFAATLIVILTIGRSDVRATAAEKSIDRVFLTSETSFAPDYARGRIVGLWFTDVGNDPVAGFTIDSGHVRVRLQCFRMCPAGTSVVLQARGAGVVRSKGTDRPTAFVSVPIPPEVPWGIYRVWLFDDGRVARLADGERAGFPNQAYYLVSIPPPSDARGNDPHLVCLRKADVGHIVQGFGSLSISCSDTQASGISGEINVGNEPSLRVTALERPLSPIRKWRVGAQMDRRYNQDWLFTVVSPIRVRFRAGRYDGRFCAHPQMWLADEWEVERMLWVHRANGQMSVNAFANSFPVRPGMNKLQVAHLLGLPSEFGTVRDMLKLDDWKYAEPAPFAYSVRFRNGVVAEVHPPGNLP